MARGGTPLADFKKKLKFLKEMLKLGIKIWFGTCTINL